MYIYIVYKSILPELSAFQYFNLKTSQDRYKDTYLKPWDERVIFNEIALNVRTCSSFGYPIKQILLFLPFCVLVVTN